MSDHRILLVATALLALGVAEPLTAQPRAPGLDSLLVRVMALDTIVARRTRVVDSVRRVLAKPVPPIDVSRGPLRVRTTGDLEPRVRVAVDSAAALVARRDSRQLDARIAGRVPSVTRDSAAAVFGMTQLVSLAPDTGRRWSALGRRHIPASAAASALGAALIHMVEEFALQGADSALSAWVMLGRAPLAAGSANEASDVYIELATTESAVLRRCRTGDAAACLDALGVDSVAGGRLARWYTGDDHRSLLRAVAPPRDDSAAVVAWLRCRGDRDAEACNVAAHALPDDRVPLPLSASARFMFLREVLDAGGAGAYDRLLESPGTLKTRLAAASREPVDATVRRWLARVERSQPQRAAVPGTLALATLGWSGALLALTLTRRGPWT